MMTVFQSVKDIEGAGQREKAQRFFSHHYEEWLPPHLGHLPWAAPGLWVGYGQAPKDPLLVQINLPKIIFPSAFYPSWVSVIG